MKRRFVSGKPHFVKSLGLWWVWVGRSGWAGETPRIAWHEYTKTRPWNAPSRQVFSPVALDITQ